MEDKLQLKLIKQKSLPPIEENKIAEKEKEANTNQQDSINSDPNSSSKPLITPANKTPNTNNAPRFKSEVVRKNWKTVLDVALKEKSRLNDFSDSVNLNNNLNGFNPVNHNAIYATNKENWIFFSIIISIVILLSIMFCLLVYKFFPQFRSNY